MRADSRAPELTTTAARPRGSPILPLVVGLLGLFFLFPLGYLAWSTLGFEGGFWTTVLSSRTLGPLRNSLLIAAATSAACLVLGTGLAWLVARTDLPGRRFWRLVLPLPLVIPSFVGATAMTSAFGRGGLVPFIPRIEGFWGAFIVLTLLSYPYVYLPVWARLSTTMPSVEEAARLLGSPPLRTVVKVVIPQIRYTMAAGTMLVFLYGLSDFGAVMWMRYDTITRAIFSARLFDRATSLTLGLLLAVLALGVASVERMVARDRKVGPRIGRQQVQYRLGKASVAGVGLAAGVVGLALVAPVAVFLVWVLRGSTAIGVGYSGLSSGLGFLAGPSLNSAIASVTAGICAVAITFPVAFAVARRRTWISKAAAAVVTSVFALPGLVVALAVVFWAIQAPGPMAALYQSFPLLIVTYVLHFGAQSMRSSQVAIADIPTRYEDAARTLGARARRRLFSIYLPLTMPGLVTGAGLVLLSTLKELPATLLLAPTGFETLATRIWNAAEDGFYSEVGITSLVLILLSGGLTWILVLRRELRG